MSSAGSRTSTADLPHPSRSARGHVVWVVAAISTVVLLLHGLALFDGVVLDDHWHQKGLREHGWSFTEILRTLIIAPADFIDCWWQTEPVVWHYFRPFFIICMKLAYIVGGRGDETALHALSLGMHWLSSLLVWRLCLRLTGDRFWSLIGGLLFAVYPHSVVTVAWPSSQNVVIQNTLLLVVVLMYLRATRCEAAECRPYVRSALVWTWVLWLLAIFTRENAILFPAILASFELAYGGWRRLWARRWFFIACGIVGVAFMIWRTALGIDPLPDVYCRRPDGDLLQYAAWLAAKFLHYICVSIWPAPMVAGPTGRMNPWTESPGDCLLMTAIVCVMGWVYFTTARRAKGWWIWPMWVVLSILPVVAVVATPHSGYMSGVGLAVGVALGAAAARRERDQPHGRQRYALASSVAMGVVFGSAFMAPVTRLQWMGTAAAERILPGWVMLSPPPQSATDVFFINMPFVNIYAKPDLDKRLGPGFSGVRVHALTFAPHPTVMDRRSTIEQIDERSFVVSVDGQAYFSRLLGRFVVEAFGDPKMFSEGRVIETASFNVTIIEKNEQGVWKLKFTFPRPLADSTYCFYFTSSACGAARLRFGGGDVSGGASRPSEDAIDAGPWGAPDWHAPREQLTGSAELVQAAAYLEAGYAAAAMPLLTIAADANHPLRSEAGVLLRPVMETMTTSLGARSQFAFDEPVVSAAAWAEIRSWWAATITNATLREVWGHRHDFDHYVWLRAENEFDRWIASGLIRTDLYLTGEPYAGPFRR